MQGLIPKNKMCACASHVSCLQYVPQFSAAAFDSKFGYVRTQLHKQRVYIYEACPCIFTQTMDYDSCHLGTGACIMETIMVVRRFLASMAVDAITYVCTYTYLVSEFPAVRTMIQT
jgi:hypothetical protein